MSKFDTILKNEIKRLNQARKNNIRLNANTDDALYELNRNTIKTQLDRLKALKV